MDTIKWDVFAICEQIYYPSEENVNFLLSISNFSSTPIKISNIEIVFDFNIYYFNDLNFIINSGIQAERKYQFRLPRLDRGKKMFFLNYDVSYYYNNMWKHYRRFESKDIKYFIIIQSLREINTSRLNIFVSRGLLPKDRQIGDFIVNHIKRWNFSTRTVGIEVNSKDEKAAERIRKEISTADAMIAIATPRNKITAENSVITTEWIQNEIGIAYGTGKPLLVFQEDEVTLTALPKYLTKYNGIPLIIFNRNDRLQIINTIYNFMEIFRKSIKEDRDNKFFTNLMEKGALIGLGVILSSAINSNNE